MYGDYFPENNDLAKFTKSLAEIHNPDRIPSYSRKLVMQTETGFRVFFEVRGLGVIVVESVGSDAKTGKVLWKDCGILTNEEIGYYSIDKDA
jgi:hypothetical protein